MPRPRPGPRERPPGAPDWCKDAVIYEVHVRAFRDSNGDGIGDFRGLTEKLDYLADLGVTALWLLPFFPSPGRDDGYDTSDYTAVHPDYGTLADVSTFVAEAHRRGLRVIAEVVLNHTSDQHPWFQRARRAPPGSPSRRLYVWSDSPDRYPEARVIFRDFETSNWAWDPVAGAYYWHRFYTHQPDLNYENPHVHREILRVVDFWLSLGFDGLRLDAVPYLYEADGTNCENLPATHAFLRRLRRHVDERYGDRMLLAEANQWPEDAVEYFGGGAGDECHMAFHFPLMPRLFMALRTEDRFPILDILEQTPAIPETAQWATFLRNHDELTLEMVTDEERDYMYRAYAGDPAARINLGIRRRLAPLAGTRRQLELLNSLLFSLPGTPVLYYGDEIGMGDDYHLDDRNGVRTPMQWTSGRNAGFSEGSRRRLYMPLIVDPEYHFERVNVAAQAANPSSLLSWTKQIIALRRRHPALVRGTFEVVPTSNRHILAYRREHEDETIVAVANLSRHAQWCELELAPDAGRRVVELFGGTEFPALTGRPYPLVVGAHSFLWFRLETADDRTGGAPVPVPAADGTPAGLVAIGAGRGTPLAGALARWLTRDPDYRRQGVVASSTRVAGSFPLAVPGRRAALLLVRAETRSSETLTVPLLVEAVDASDDVAGRSGGVVARLRDRGEAVDRGVLLDISADPEIGRQLGWLAVGDPSEDAGGMRLRGRAHERPPRSNEPRRHGGESPAPTVRLLGRIDAALPPEDVAARELLAAGAPVEPVIGWLEAIVEGRPAAIGLAIAERVGGGTTFADEAAASLDRLLDAVASEGDVARPGRFASSGLVETATANPDDFVAGELFAILGTARQVGASLAGLHDALARPIGPAPEPFTAMSRRALYQAVRTLLGEVVDALREAATPADAGSEGAATPWVAAAVASRPALDGRFRGIVARHLDGLRIATYGRPIEASRLVRSGEAFVIGVPGPDLRHPADRQRIRSPLADVAGVLASLRRIALRPVCGPGSERRGLPPEDARHAEGWARSWWAHVGGAVVASHAAALARPALIPSAVEDRALVLDLLLAQVTLDGLLGDLRAGLPPDPTALVGLVDLAEPDGAAPA